MQTIILPVLSQERCQTTVERFAGLDALIIAIGPDAAFSRANEVGDVRWDPGKLTQRILYHSHIGSLKYWLFNSDPYNPWHPCDWYI